MRHGGLVRSEVRCGLGHPSSSVTLQGPVTCPQTRRSRCRAEQVETRLSGRLLHTSAASSAEIHRTTDVSNRIVSDRLSRRAGSCVSAPHALKPRLPLLDAGELTFASRGNAETRVYLPTCRQLLHIRQSKKSLLKARRSGRSALRPHHLVAARPRPNNRAE